MGCSLGVDGGLMAFGQVFGGFCVLHAPFATANRRRVFEALLRDVGVASFTVVEAEQILPGDSRIGNFKTAGEASLIGAAIRAVVLAKNNDWASVVIFEDDILFRMGFHRRWTQVEREVVDTYWDVLTFHRWSYGNDVIVENPWSRTSLLPLRYTRAAHAFALRRSAYDQILQIMYQMQQEGRPLDFLFGRANRAGARVLATSHNLTGQSSELTRSTTAEQEFTHSRGHTFFATFGSYRSRSDFLVAKAARHLKRATRVVTGLARRTSRRS